MTIETRVRGNNPPSGGGDSAGLAGTGLTYVLSSFVSGYPNALYIKPGSSVTTHITGSNLFINATTSTFAGSGGLAGTGNTYLFSSLVAGYPNALYIKPGSSVTTHITGSNLFINATTSAAFTSGGLAGTGHTYLFSSLVAGYPSALYIKPGSSVTTHITGSNLFINATTSTFAGTGGLAGTGGFYVMSTANTAYPNSRQLQAGSSTIVRTDGPNIYIDAITPGAAASSGGLAGTGGFFVLSTANTAWPNARQLVSGSSTTVRTDGTNIYIDATTSAGGSSGGLAGTGGFFVLSTANTAWPNSRQFLAGSSTIVRTDGTNIYVDAITPGAAASSGGLAGTGGFFVLSTANTAWPNARQLVSGSSTTVRTDGTNIYIDATTSAGGSSGGLAGTGNTYIFSSLVAGYPNALYIKPGSSVTVHITGSNMFVNALTNGFGKNFMPLLPQQSKMYPSTSAARVDAATAWWRLLYSQLTQQYGVWQFICPPDYGSNPYIRLSYCLCSTLAAAKTTIWGVSQWGIPDSLTITPTAYLYLDTFGTINTMGIALSAGYSSGTIQMMTIPLVNAISLAAGNLIRIRITNTGLLAGINDSALSSAKLLLRRIYLSVTIGRNGFGGWARICECGCGIGSVTMQK